jgi:ribosomal protection tetracycline resistance protein
LSEPTLNLGILAHVDAGKTTLTERLLHTAGVIDEPGSVDAGTTQTDTLALERQRGITIKSAVVSFPVDGVTVNLIDTPGHPDFIAEVERVLGVLDGAVLVISAVEGVQPQTTLLMRALQRLGVPTLIFVNKIDRRGADAERTLAAIEERLTPAVCAMGAPAALGTPAASFATYGPADDELVERSRHALLHPVYFGSALTGGGVESLKAGIVGLLPAAAGDPAGRVSGRVFKIERDPDGGRVAYVRMFSGVVRVRDRLPEGKVTAIHVFADGGAARRDCVVAGQIAKLHGLAEVRVGDPIGEPPAVPEHHFAPPTLETVVVPVETTDGARLRLALGQLAEQDPLIDVRQDEWEKLSVSLYGEVQKEVIQATLASDYGLGVTFCETTVICVERPIGIGEAAEVLHSESNPFAATIGLRIEPAPVGSGVEFRLDVGPRSAPLYIYKTFEAFGESMAGYVRDALREGVAGWQVADCVVTMNRCSYQSPDGSAATRGPLSTAADFRKLTPIVVRQALRRARTDVCEPVLRVRLEIPAAATGPALGALGRLGASVPTPALDGSHATVEAELPAARVPELRRQLPALTGGEGVLESDFAGYRPVAGERPVRPGTKMV